MSCLAALLWRQRGDWTYSTLTVVKLSRALVVFALASLVEFHVSSFARRCCLEEGALAAALLSSRRKLALLRHQLAAGVARDGFDGREEKLAAHRSDSPRIRPS